MTKWTLLLAIAPVLAACTTADRNAPAKGVTPAPMVNLPRYMGDWHVIANIPYFAEKNCFGSIERYKLLPDGRIDTVFLAKKGGLDGKPFEARSVAHVTNPKNNAEWQIRFLGRVVRIPLTILYVSPDYQSAAVATPDRKLAWIFSRERTISPADYAKAVEVLKTNGIPTEKLALVPQ